MVPRHLKVPELERVAVERPLPSLQNQGTNLVFSRTSRKYCLVILSLWLCSKAVQKRVVLIFLALGKYRCRKVQVFILWSAASNLGEIPHTIRAANCLFLRALLEEGRERFSSLSEPLQRIHLHCADHHHLPSSEQAPLGPPMQVVLD